MGIRAIRKNDKAVVGHRPSVVGEWEISWLISGIQRKRFTADFAQETQAKSFIADDRGATTDDGCYTSPMPLVDQIQKDIVAAMKSRDEARLSTLRMVKTALQLKTVEKMSPLDDKESQA